MSDKNNKTENDGTKTDDNQKQPPETPEPRLSVENIHLDSGREDLIFLSCSKKDQDSSDSEQNSDS
ncbi:hypothetical protein [Cyanobacterium aponinum]|uniref:hypothetical protein n=1 Tax=Cyanobacterium aponinum TaxID=379064 RepID=UPI000C12D391|nr:hypothetical protein [Cyanobacterium aponinum]PHV61000.1 hypothetical protein CSQ80_17970 [Cyanobacterium aponinum IPPAS B-1201]